MKDDEIRLKKDLYFQLSCIGEDPEREGLKDTPKRVIRAWNEIFSGYHEKVEDIMTCFGSDGYDQIILLKDVEMYSTCEHHMLPFIGKAHIAYLPDKKIIGISKLARLLEIYSRRLQIQERIGQQVTDALMKYLEPKGAACVISAQHLCMQMRGVSKQNSVMITSSMKGVFLTDASAKNELLNLIKL
jgi:GTP cyclohydrolase IA